VAALLYITFMLVPSLHVHDAFRDRRLLTILLGVLLDQCTGTMTPQFIWQQYTMSADFHSVVVQAML